MEDNEQDLWIGAFLAVIDATANPGLAKEAANFAVSAFREACDQFAAQSEGHGPTN